MARQLTAEARERTHRSLDVYPSDHLVSTRTEFHGDNWACVACGDEWACECDAAEAEGD